MNQMNLTIEELKLIADYLSIPFQAFKLYDFKETNELYQKIIKEVTRLKRDQNSNQ